MLRVVRIKLCAVNSAPCPEIHFGNMIRSNSRARAVDSAVIPDRCRLGLATSFEFATILVAECGRIYG